MSLRAKQLAEVVVGLAVLVAVTLIDAVLAPSRTPSSRRTTATYWTSSRPRKAPMSPPPWLPMPMPPMTIRSLAGGRPPAPNAHEVMT